MNNAMEHINAEERIQDLLSKLADAQKENERYKHAVEENYLWAVKYERSFVKILKMLGKYPPPPNCVGAPKEIYQEAEEAIEELVGKFTPDTGNISMCNS
jgi:hypothetical protein